MNEINQLELQREALVEAALFYALEKGCLPSDVVDVLKQEYQKNLHPTDKIRMLAIDKEINKPLPF